MDDDDLSPFDGLVLSQDWDAVRRNVRQQLPSYDQFQESPSTIQISIKSLLTYGKGEYPLDILQLLFEKNRYPEEEEDSQERLFSGYGSDSRLGRVLNIHFCCRTCPHFGVPPLLPLAVFELILKEFARNKNYVRQECSEHALIRLFDVMWENFILKPNDEENDDGKSYPRQEVEEQLRSVQSIDDLGKPSNAELQNLWERSLMIFRLGGIDISTIPLLLHHLIENGYPVFLVWLVGKLYPNQLFQRDEDGRIPLHYAYKFPSEPREIHCFVCGIDIGSRSYLNCLVNLYPKGAAYADSNGKLPLTRFLEKHMHSTDHSKVYGFRYDDENMTIQWNDLQLLMEGAPQALKTRDIQSHLLPFMTPALVDKNSYYDKDEVVFVNFTYDILRKDPTAISIVINPDQNVDSYHAKRLKGKISKLTEENTTLKTSLSIAEETISRQKEEIESLRRGGEIFDTNTTVTPFLKREDCNSNNNQIASSFPTASNEEDGENPKTSKRVKLEH